MTGSIFVTVKKSLGLEEDDTSFDSDILMFINSVLSNLNQAGVGPEDGLYVEDASVTWDDLLGGDNRFNNVPAFVYLKVRMLFDPPATSFAIAAIESQAKELETRIYLLSEADKWQ